MYTCAKCGPRGCSIQDLSQSLPECPSKNQELQERARKEYQQPENLRIAHQSSCTEADGYGRDTRLMEIIHFMKRCGYRRIGFAFCGGLASEAREVAHILEYHGFDVVSVVCKNGAVPKSAIGILDQETCSGNAGQEVMCNPIAQAMALNDAKTEFNIMLGLCVGHDTLFFKYVEAPVTVLAVKDRVTGHNPLAAVYCAKSYYKKVFYPE